MIDHGMRSSCPLVSVIIPVYGPTDYLADSISSVLKQSYQNWELIIVDDNSPDSHFRLSSESIVHGFISAGHNINYVKHDQNRNGAVARNTGLALASGKYVSFLDSDDAYFDQRIEVAVASLEVTGADVGGLYTGVEFRRAGRKFFTLDKIQSGRFLAQTLACEFMIGTGSNLFLKSNVVKELHGFDESFIRHQDYEFLVRFFCKYSLIAIEQVLVIKNNENFNIPKFEKLRQVKYKYFHKFRDLIDRCPGEIIAAIFESNYTSLGESALAEGLREESALMYSTARSFRDIGVKKSVRRLAFWAMSFKK